MERKIIITQDGSSSIYLPEWDESYHSKHGAIQEAYHVFIKMGLDLFENNSNLSILEIGFGTGLNCYITYLESKKRKLQITYEGVEAFPLKAEEISKMNYASELKSDVFTDIFALMHKTKWETVESIDTNFILKKRKQFFCDIKDQNKFNLIYFDAFGARVQPELWTKEIFKSMFDALKDNGVLVTYSAKGSVRRAMQSIGFKVDKLPGPPGKREMLRGVKVLN